MTPRIATRRCNHCESDQSSFLLTGGTLVPGGVFATGGAPVDADAVGAGILAVSLVEDAGDGGDEDGGDGDDGIGAGAAALLAAGAGRPDAA